jgi:hypothetical protein
VSRHVPALELGFAGGILTVLSLLTEAAWLTLGGGFGFSSWGSGGGTANCFFIYSALFLFHRIFQVPCLSFVIGSLLFFSLAVLYVLFFVITASDGESYSSAILPLLIFLYKLFLNLILKTYLPFVSSACY